MANIASLLKKEIQAQSVKAARGLVQPLEKALKAERLRVRDLERQVETLTRKLNEVAEQKAAPMQAVPSTFLSSSVTALRNQHGLTQGALAKMLGVGLNTVWLWEQGRTKPRVAQQEAISELKDLSSAALKRRLSAAGLKTGRNKPGRKKGSTNAALAKKRASAKKTAKKATKKKVRR